MPLTTAREIVGVRAVFGETYPDPVRVVSVGVEVDSLLEDVKNPKWKEVSVEFCGGTHVQKTGDIKELVILEESGIAKGVRRIIAVTGEDAHEVQRVADEFNGRLKALENMPHGPEKEQKAKTTQMELNELSISAITKASYRDRFAKVHKAVLDEQKARQKAESKVAVDTIVEYFARDENKDKTHLVTKLPISANSKALSEAINHVRTRDKDKSVYVFATDAQEGKIVHGCYVSEVCYIINLVCLEMWGFFGVADGFISNPSKQGHLRVIGRIPCQAS